MCAIKINRDCPNCNSNVSRVLFQLEAKQFTKINPTYRPDYNQVLGISDDQLFPVLRCINCNFVYAGWLPDDNFLELLYDVVIDPNLGLLASRRLSWLSRLSYVNSILLKQIDRHFRDYESIRVLDYGCGNAFMLQTLKISSEQLHVSGFETSKTRLDVLSSKNIEAFNSLESLINSKHFHVVILNEVLEHVKDFKEVLSTVYNILEPKGMVWISVPNYSNQRIKTIQNSAIKNQAYPLDLNPWEHLNYFSPENLREITRECGFREILNDTLDLGFQPSLKGLKRWRNVFGVIVRLLKFSVTENQYNTELLLEKI